VFNVGATATRGMQQMAENGNVPALVAELDGNSKVSEVAAGAAPLAPGQSVCRSRSVVLRDGPSWWSQCCFA
jgi:hypothetical protein